ncbi:Hpt domain-containing protein [Flavobacterium psychrotrophum]|uniref:Hpt domain-containing protein n=1 Tax=Flavobacterium psychrotrophum TaxID=2294119 RepID=UPI000E3239A7|nr:Hpt domain-containing protein [Flavobacterium psychrotrophum]
MTEQPNLSYINSLAGDDLEFRTALVTTIQRELPEEIAVYRTCFNAGDLKAAAAHVHKLKHKVSILGLEKSYYLAENFEEELKNNQTGMAAEFDAVLNTMQSFADSL